MVENTSEFREGIIRNQPTYDLCHIIDSEAWAPLPNKN
jgi:hypothetical protein